VTHARADLVSRVRGLFHTSAALAQRVVDQDAGTIVRMAGAVCSSVEHGGKVLLCGNGGSAAEAQHLAAEMLIRLRPRMDRGALPALALATDVSSLTACGNDYSFDAYYVRMTQAHGRPGDVLIGISTSGRSMNVVRALRHAHANQLRTLGLLGGDGGPALAECDLALVVPSEEPGRVQEVHHIVGHALMELVEDLLLETGYLTPTRYPL